MKCFRLKFLFSTHFRSTFWTLRFFFINVITSSVYVRMYGVVTIFSVIIIFFQPISSISLFLLCAIVYLVQILNKCPSRCICLLQRFSKRKVCTIPISFFIMWSVSVRILYVNRSVYVNYWKIKCVIKFISCLSIIIERLM